jgi:hypothetical protein
MSFAVGAYGQSNARPEILILGTYHMANPGHDLYNMQADDVLSAKRQSEIAELMEVLKKFHPTKIAIEGDVDGDRAKRYENYLAGNYQLTRNEIDQIGYRLAKELGHKAIYPVDVDGDFPMQRVIDYAKATGKSQQLDASMAKFGDEVKEQDSFLKSHSVLETLEFMNSDEHAAHDVGIYYEIAPLGESGDYAGPDLLAKWFERNIRIYSNIRKLADSPNDRILVIYGAGHLGWLRQDVANDRSVKLRKLSEFVKNP